MNRWLTFLVSLCVTLPVCSARGDVVIDWNNTLYEVIQLDGFNPINMANPGWSTRAIAMANAAIYDAFQAIDRTKAPFLWTQRALPNTSLEAAVHQAAYELLTDCYPGQAAFLLNKYNERMASISDDDAKARGMALGSQIAQAYIAKRTNDRADEMYDYTPLEGPGKWRPDPYWPGLLNDPPQPQEAWGPGWRYVKTFAIPNAAQFISAIPPIPALDSPEYAAAFNQVKEYGALVSPSREAKGGTEIGLFWAYDRPGMGPPPRLYVRNLIEIAMQAGNSEAENARLFAMASVAMADAAIAAWDAKFEYNFWRPVTAILEADTDGNDATEKDPNWRPLGAPGPNPADYTDDFTPPFPAWTSGHATMGGAIFKSIELFYGTNNFAEIPGANGIPGGGKFRLTSEEEGSGVFRDYSTFSFSGSLNDLFELTNPEYSPDAENALSRIFLGIHWIFDQQDGIDLGHAIADYVAANFFYPVPEPNSLLLALITLASFAATRRYRGN